MISRRLAVAAAVVGALLLGACSSGASSPGATGVTAPPRYRYVVSLGDSYIAGEGDRWAGNTSGGFEQVDALGAHAYGAPGAMPIAAGCDRADLPEVAVDFGDVRGRNLACSGAETTTETGSRSFTPGIDFFHDGSRLGQALALQRFAGSHQVTAVVLSIGGNDFGFSSILSRCIQDFVTTAGGAAPSYCSDDPTITALFAPRHVALVRDRIEKAIANVATAMRGTARYRIIVQNYPSPIPPGPRIRYPETVAARFGGGGCPLFDRDATWANRYALRIINQTVADAVARSGQANVTLMDVSALFDGHRLCEDGVGQLQQTRLRSWRSPGAANDLEWVNELYLKGAPWQTRESLHPNYWGTAAERNCLRQVLRSGRRGSDPVTCRRDGTAMDGLEPSMTLGTAIF